jgi:hypothetical protein
MKQSENVNTISRDTVLGAKAQELAPLVKKWAKINCNVSFSILVRRGLKKELKPLAGKRYAHLVEN